MDVMDQYFRRQSEVRIADIFKKYLNEIFDELMTHLLVALRIRMTSRDIPPKGLQFSTTLTNVCRI